MRKLSVREINAVSGGVFINGNGELQGPPAWAQAFSDVHNALISLVAPVAKLFGITLTPPGLLTGAGKPE